MNLYGPEGGGQSTETTEETATEGRFSPEVLERAANRRVETAAVANYLRQLRVSNQRRRPDMLRRHLATVETKLAEPGVTDLERLRLIQRRLELKQKIRSYEKIETVDYTDDFVKHAASFAQRKNISRAAWLEMGVSRRVLEMAGINRDPRGRKSPAEDAD